ncbi:MAG TPA: hypothetical protein VLV50_19325 [Stellaceae bacterium]|nr:hypothetical protein [Stellaceae bacterium]
MPDASGADAPYIAALEGANLHPLWDGHQRITPVQLLGRQVLDLLWSPLSRAGSRAIAMKMLQAGRRDAAIRASRVPRECWLKQYQRASGLNVF